MPTDRDQLDDDNQDVTWSATIPGIARCKEANLGRCGPLGLRLGSEFEELCISCDSSRAPRSVVVNPRADTAKRSRHARALGLTIPDGLAQEVTSWIQ